MLLKQLVTEQSQKNKRLLTKQNKVKGETEKVLKNIQEAKQVQKAPAPRAPTENPSDLAAEFKKMISGGGARGGAKNNGGDKGFLTTNFCGCGDTNPIYKGYCANCITTLKERFQQLLDQMDEVNEEYNNFNVDQQA